MCPHPSLARVRVYFDHTADAKFTHPHPYPHPYNFLAHATSNILKKTSRRGPPGIHYVCICIIKRYGCRTYIFIKFDRALTCFLMCCPSLEPPLRIAHPATYSIAPQLSLDTHSHVFCVSSTFPTRRTCKCDQRKRLPGSLILGLPLSSLKLQSIRTVCRRDQYIRTVCHL